MFEVAYETTFCATHVLTDAGRPIEPVHGHDWRVEVVAAGESLDRLGVVVSGGCASGRPPAAARPMPSRHPPSPGMSATPC